MSMPVISSGDQAWVLASTALVQIMTPGVAFFYVRNALCPLCRLSHPHHGALYFQSGLVGEDSVLSTMMLSIGSMGVVTVLWCE